MNLYSLLKYSTNVNEIDKYREDIAKLIPEVKIMFDFDQKNSAHQYDLWFHSLHVVVGLPRGLSDSMLYLGALLHDIGKPAMQVYSEKDGEMHYKGHQDKSLEILDEKILPRLNLSDEDGNRLRYYVKHHDDHIGVRLKYMREHLKLQSFDTFYNLLLLELSDAEAHVQIPVVAKRVSTMKILISGAALDNYHRIQRGE